MQDFLDDLDQLYSRTREHEENGYKFVIQANDPYGFWSVMVLKLKKQPEILQQQFTNIGDAKRACSIWAKSQSDIPADTTEEPPVEPIKYKKRVNK